MDGEDGVKDPASRVTYDQEAQVVGADTCFAKRQVFQYGVVLTVTRSLFKGSEWRRPEIVNAVLAPITRGLDAQVHRTIDFSESGAPRALATKLNDPQQLARCWRARVGSCTTGRERFLLRINAGQHVPPICGGPPRAFIGQGSGCPAACVAGHNSPISNSIEAMCCRTRMMSGPIRRGHHDRCISPYRWWSPPGVAFRELL